jgi:hypothetical protein
MECLECGNKEKLETRFLVIPINMYVPNQYFLCEKHKDKTFDFYDIYNEDGTKKI